MKKFNMLMLVFALALYFVGTASADEGKDESGKGKRRSPASRYHHGGESRSYFETHGYTHLRIPKGHYPPPGECRIWFPDRPAGQQPPPGDCRRLRSEVPPGAWLIRHPGDDKEHVHVIAYDDGRPDRHGRPGGILAIGEFEIGTGNFVRVVVDR